MPNADEDWLKEVPAHLRPPLARCARGELPPAVALMQILVEARDPAEAAAALDAAIGSMTDRDAGAATRLRETVRLLRANPQAWATIKSILSDLDHGGTAPSPEDGIARWAELFDRAVRVSPEASVALYSLGNPDLLRATTAEIVGRMRDWGLLGAERDILEIGCGIGRFQEALAAEARTVVGIDISREMIETARRRCAGLANVRLLVTSGRDLSPFTDESFDLVFAVDSFPYLVQSGMALAERHLHEAVRVLRPEGDVLILNFSYRGDLDADRADLARLAAETGLTLQRNGTGDFALWDGTAFHLRKSGTAGASG